MEKDERTNLFDRPLAEWLKLDGEKMAYILIAIAAVASRFWNLGARAMSWDECTHGLFSYYLYSGSGYNHDPMMHGPFLFHANALVFFLLGDSDYTVRLVPALLGVALVLSPLLLRRWLGRAGALLTSLLLLISPSLLYYSRYIRNDIYIALWSVLLAAALFHFLETRRPRWLYLGAAGLTLALATKENAYFVAYTGLFFVGLVVVWQRAQRRDRPALYVGGAALSLALLLAGALLAPAQVEGAPPALAAKALDALLLVVGGTIPMGLVAARLIASRRPAGDGASPAATSIVEEALRGIARRQWLIALGLAAAVYSLLFTTFFSNPAGLASGIWGSLSYWLGQQEVQRGSQPWYYYGLLLALYEFLPLLLGLAGMGYSLVRGPKEEVKTRTGDLFVAFTIFWTLTSLFIYAWAGEKMPWMMVHQALPLILLAGRFGGHLLTRESRGSRPRMAAFAAGLLCLAALTVRFAWMASYVNFDYATEPLVYAHGGADVKPLMDEIASISQQTVGGKQIELAYDQEAAWPLEWYLREYDNRIFFGDRPTRASLNAPIVIASAELDPKVQSFLRQRYYRFRRREIWWPNEQYMDLSWQRIAAILASPEKRASLWQILYYRQYPRTTDDWYHVDYVYLYVRKDVAAQIWAAGLPAASPPSP
ncbi:MAG: TIGR03663 family protein [Anaerolineae bacterium]|jgi:uncharacterized protein (TIGR03663 family)